jgi:hypothetical protein
MNGQRLFGLIIQTRVGDHGLRIIHSILPVGAIEAEPPALPVGMLYTGLNVRKG